MPYLCCLSFCIQPLNARRTARGVSYNENSEEEEEEDNDEDEEVGRVVAVVSNLYSHDGLWPLE